MVEKRLSTLVHHHPARSFLDVGVEELLQLGGEFRVAGEKLRRIGPEAAVGGFQVVQQDFEQPVFLTARVRTVHS